MEQSTGRATDTSCAHHQVRKGTLNAHARNSGEASMNGFIRLKTSAHPRATVIFNAKHAKICFFKLSTFVLCKTKIKWVPRTKDYYTKEGKKRGGERGKPEWGRGEGGDTEVLRTFV